MNLNRRIDGKNLAWDASTFKSEADFTYELPSKVLAELAETTLPKEYNEVASKLGAFPKLRTAMSEFQRTHLREVPGFGIIKGLGNTNLGREDQEIVYWMMCNLLGSPLPQNAKGDLKYEVKDKGKSMKRGARYSETNEGGALHTDSVQWPEPPDVFGLLCLHPAKEGGESLVVSAHTVHNILSRECPGLLDVLYNPFPFEARGVGGRVEIISQPVFTYDDKNGLKFRYIGTYVACAFFP